jgi:hypothetical protein
LFAVGLSPAANVKSCLDNFSYSFYKKETKNDPEAYMASERKREIKRRRHRKDKIKKLRAQLAEASNKAEKEKIIAKIRKVSPTAPIEVQ